MPYAWLGQQIAKQLFRVARYNQGACLWKRWYGGEPIKLQYAIWSRPTHIGGNIPGQID
ncbi:MAG: hypothetical protein IPH89_12220 [Bacteroidetes bacterium]|nr:hypothetical protein [Bacteroidota bacterium]